MRRILPFFLFLAVAMAPSTARAFLYPQLFHHDNAAALAAEAETARAEGRLDDAAKAYTLAINTGDLDPADMAAAYEGRGRVRLSQDDPHQALADFRRSIEIAPSRAGGFLGRARTWLLLGQPEQAAQDVDSAATRCTDCPEMDELRALLAAPPAPGQ